MTAEEQISFKAVVILSFTLIIFSIFSFKPIIMVFTRNQTENMSKDKFVEKLLKLLVVSSKLSGLTEKLNDFVSKHD